MRWGVLWRIEGGGGVEVGICGGGGYGFVWVFEVLF